jgi:hypothetical protein
MALNYGSPESSDQYIELADIFYNPSYEELTQKMKMKIGSQILIVIARLRIGI